jgi:hypothetical protein
LSSVSWFARNRVTALLLLVAVGLVVLVVVDRGRVSTGEAAARSGQLLDAWRPKDVDALIIESDGHRYELKRKRAADGSTEWSLLEDGKSARPDEQTVEQYLVALEFAAFERRASGDDSATMGLDAPTLRIGLSMGALHYDIAVGKTAPTPPESRYVSVSGGARGSLRYVIAGKLFDALRPEPGEFRVRRLIPYLSFELSRLELQRATDGWVMTRGGWGGRTEAAFALDSGGRRVRVSHRRFAGWLAALAELDALRFVDVPAKLEAEATLVMVPSDSKKPKAVLAIGGACPDGGRLVVRKQPDPTAACLPDKPLAAVLGPASGLIDEHVVGAPETDILELQLGTGPQRVELARKDKSWHMRAPDEGPADPDAVKRWLAALLQARGKQLQGEAANDAAALGLDPPAAELRVVSLKGRGDDAADSDRVEVVEVGQPRDGRVHVRRREDGTVWVLSEAVAAPLRPHPALLKPLRVFEFKPRRVRHVAIDCDGKQQRLTRDLSGSWSLDQPASKLGADPAMATELSQALSQLTAVRWLVTLPEDDGLQQPWCSIDLEVAAEEAPSDASKNRMLQLRVGSQIQGGYVARQVGSHTAFVAPRRIAAVARHWLLDRSALMIDPKTVTRVTVEHDGGRVELKRVAGRWLGADGGPAPGLAGKLDAVLSNLVAEGVVRRGAPAASDGLASPRLKISVEREGAPLREMLVGAGDQWRDTRVFYLRASDYDVTFAVAQPRLRPLLDAL